jgi:hypothetical protein
MYLSPWAKLDMEPREGHLTVEKECMNRRLTTVLFCT